MTKARHGNTASIYRIRQPAHRADTVNPPGLCQPIYRGFRLACIGAEIEAVKRKIDVYWSARYVSANTPADLEALNMEERTTRFEPKELTGT